MPGPGPKGWLYNLLEEGCPPKLGCHIPIKFVGQVEDSVHKCLVMYIGGRIPISIFIGQSILFQFGLKVSIHSPTGAGLGIGIGWSFNSGMES